jgi:hypothetical protein
MVRLRVVIGLHGGGPDDMALLRWTIVQLIDALKSAPIPVTVEIEAPEDS